MLPPPSRMRGTLSSLTTRSQCAAVLTKQVEQVRLALPDEADLYITIKGDCVSACLPGLLQELHF